MAKCPQCGEEVLLTSGGWNWLTSFYFIGLSGRSSPFQAKLFACSKCGASSLSVRVIDILVFRVNDLFPLFVFTAGLFASIPWLNFNNVWYFLVLYPLGFAALWFFVLYQCIVNFWWREVAQLKTVDDPESVRNVRSFVDIAIYILLVILGGQGLMFLIKHVFFK